MSLVPCRMTTGSSHESFSESTVSQLEWTRPASCHLCLLMVSWPSWHLASLLIPPSALLLSPVKTSLQCLALTRSKAGTCYQICRVMPVFPLLIHWAPLHLHTTIGSNQALEGMSQDLLLMTRKFLLSIQTLKMALFNWLEDLNHFHRWSFVYTSHRRHLPNKELFIFHGQSYPNNGNTQIVRVCV